MYIVFIETVMQFETIKLVTATQKIKNLILYTCIINKNHNISMDFL